MAMAWSKLGVTWITLTILFGIDYQFSLVSQSCPTVWTAACQASLTTPTPRACSNSCLSSQRCHPTILSSVVPFSSWKYWYSIWCNIDTNTDGRALTSIRPAEAWKNIYLLHPLPFLLPPPCLPVDVLLLWKLGGFLVERNHFGRQFDDMLQIWR